MGRSSNFTERQKADLFVRDHATCAYTGKSLWLLDGGVTPYFDVDWADHVVPVARGGQSTLANGVAACFSRNAEKRDLVGQHAIQFLGGKPTRAYLKVRGTVPANLQRHFKRFARLHYSDWFFNRAIFRTLLGIAYLADDESTRSRGDLYYARAALRSVEAWRRYSTKYEIPPMGERALIPKRLRADQRILLSLREQTSVEGIRQIMRRLVPTYRSRSRTTRR